MLIIIMTLKFRITRLNYDSGIRKI